MVVEMPISPLNASAACWAMVGTPAFQPKRPSMTLSCSRDQTWFGLPEMPSLLASSGSAIGEDLLLGHGFEQAKPDHRRRDARRDHDVGADRAVAEVGQRIMRRAQARRVSPSASFTCCSLYSIFSLPSAARPWIERVLKLAAIGRLGQRVHAMGRELRLLLIGRGGTESLTSIEPESSGTSAESGRMAAAVLQMAVLAGAGIEQRPKPVGGVGRGRRRHPVLAEDGVADLEVELALEIHIAGGEREGVGGVGRAARGGAAAGLLLARLRAW